MDPQKNANPAVSDEQKDAPVTPEAPQDTTPTTPDVAVPDANTEAPSSDSGVSATSSEPASAPFSSDAVAASPATDVNTLPAAEPASTDVGLAGEAPSSDLPAGDASGTLAPVTEVQTPPPAVGEVTTPVEPSSPVADPASVVTPEAPAVPPTAPTPAPAGDKKTVMVLAGVAVVLIAAIAVLYFM